MSYRRSGVLLPISALPSDYGIGDIGPDAYKFVDWLKDAGQGLWQILPLSNVDKDGSPYSSSSAYGCNPYLISVEKLAQMNLLDKEDIAKVNLFGDKVDYELVKEYKTVLFYRAYTKFLNDSSLEKEFLNFIKEEQDWLNDYAIFQVLAEQLGHNWVKWPPNYRYRDHRALNTFANNNTSQINFHKFLQFIFFKQWFELKQYANDKNVMIIGDIPIFISHDSMDVWKNPEFFLLAAGEPYVVTGAPPDKFSPYGQRWGNPNYDWWALEQTGFDWWIKRVKYNLKLYNIIRLDHFRGFVATWECPTDREDPRTGYWSYVPGDNLFHCLTEKIGILPVIAEDLGKITPDVDYLREKYHFPGMKVLQFAFDDGDNNVYLPHNYTSDNCVVYTGTHDNQTTKGWFLGLGDTLEKSYAYKYCGAWNEENINWSMITVALNSRARFAIIPLQDILGLGNEGRINTPGVAKGNWSWRFKWNMLKTQDSDHLKELTFNSGR